MSAGTGLYRGTELYRIVEEYAALGDHRTGTAVDARSARWLGQKLAGIGAEVSEHPFGFDFYEARARVAIGGREVPALALYYEGIGSVETNSPLTAELSVDADEHAVSRALEAIAARARREGASAVVVATRGPSDGLCAINRAPRLREGVLTALVPGAVAKELRDAALSVQIRARIEPREAFDLIARLGPGTAPPVVITTPFSGWFGCAGERGTGIAVLLPLARALAERHPVLIVATSGHELGFLGAWRFVETLETAPRAVVHLGSCVAASAAPPADGGAAITRKLRSLSNAAPDRLGAIERALAPLGVGLRRPADPADPHQWYGESACWAGFRCPMLSVAGEFDLFHTPEDTPERATTPALLELAASRVTAAAVALVG